MASKSPFSPPVIWYGVNAHFKTSGGVHQEPFCRCPVSHFILNNITKHNLILHKKRCYLWWSVEDEFRSLCSSVVWYYSSGYFCMFCQTTAGWMFDGCQDFYTGIFSSMMMKPTDNGDPLTSQRMPHFALTEFIKVRKEEDLSVWNMVEKWIKVHSELDHKFGHCDKIGPFSHCNCCESKLTTAEVLCEGANDFLNADTFEAYKSCRVICFATRSFFQLINYFVFIYAPMTVNKKMLVRARRG